MSLLYVRCVVWNETRLSAEAEGWSIDCVLRDSRRFKGFVLRDRGTIYRLCTEREERSIGGVLRNWDDLLAVHWWETEGLSVGCVLMRDGVMIYRLCAERQGQSIGCVLRDREIIKWAQLMGVTTMSNKKTLFGTIVDHDKRFKAYSNQFFADCNWLVMLMSCSDA